MKLIVTFCLVAVACAAPQQRDVQILRFDNDNNGLGNYRWAFDQSDGTRHEQRGELTNQGRENEALVVRGQYSWIGPDGVTYIVTYVADDQGFQPQIEQGPGGGVPPAVVASLLG
ncbi:endocuticle structural glycoprotein ABD-5-like [Hyposmocoma kahamanoa]|uniref:endocuticle structural glycoprotein ABD-5-like n=1 Tax=Hyposmocoma kahamanoa TaxID=1477025 RepID=UPI000E6D5D7A|nr:endocuticle structural glycoprotein ABD-5-like [Hyposmocoma kahamanoa]